MRHSSPQCEMCCMDCVNACSLCTPEAYYSRSYQCTANVQILRSTTNAFCDDKTIQNPPVCCCNCEQQTRVITPMCCAPYTYPSYITTSNNSTGVSSHPQQMQQMQQVCLYILLSVLWLWYSDWYVLYILLILEEQWHDSNKYQSKHK